MTSPQAAKTLLALLVAIGVSGCTSSGSGPAGEGTDSVIPPTAPPPRVERDTCGILGAVVDDEWLPVPGATVALPANERRTLSALDGSYSFGSLEPGPYQIIAGRTDYSLIGPQYVECVAGQVVEASELVLRRVAEPGFKMEKNYRGIIGCGGHIKAVVAALPISDYCSHPILTDGQQPDLPEENQGNSTYIFQADPGNLTGFVVELAWTPNSAGSARELFLDGTWLNNDQWLVESSGEAGVASSGEQLKVQARGESPLWVRGWVGPKASGPIQMITPETPLHKYTVRDANIQSNVGGQTGAEAELLIQQEFDLYVTYFYDNMTIPDGFTVLPD